MNELRFSLAPLKGFTDMVYRRAWWACFTGLDEAYAPFVSTVAARKIKPAYFKELRAENNPGILLVPQVMTKSADDFIYLAGVLGTMGFSKINWNLGCPSTTVTSRGRGAALMARPGEVADILARVIPAVRQTLGIKMRLGYDNPCQGLELIEIFEAHDLGEIIIHPRLATQGYSGRVDLDGFVKCLRRSRHKIIYNGDIACPKGFRDLAERLDGVSEWMLGRGVLADPFLPSVVKGVPPPSEIEAHETILRFHSLVFEGYQATMHGESHLLARMKAFWHNLAPSFAGGAKFLKLVRKCRWVSDYDALVMGFMKTRPEWAPELRRDTIWWDR